MRFATKVILLLVLGSVAPVLASGVISALLSSDAVQRETSRLQGALAQQTASHLGGWFAAVVGDLRRTGRYLPFASATRDEIATLLRLPFRQLDYVTALLLLDGSGKAVVPPVFLPRSGAGPIPDDLRGRPRLEERDLQELARHVPVALALRRGAAFGPAYRASAGERLVCAVKLPTADAGRPALLAAEIALEPVRRILLSSGAGRAFLLDGRGRVAAATVEGRFAADLSRLPSFGGSAGATYASVDGERVLGASRPIPVLGFSVLLEEPVAAALGGARRLWLYTLAWTIVCLLFALGGGVYLARAVSRPVQQLAAAATRIQAGDYRALVPAAADPVDELAQLAAAFNGMAAAVDRSMQLIQTQKDELQTWNEELHRRVEERTREVQEALQQVIRSQKLGALAELGAGLAHEMNNPLTAIMGLTQLALLQLPGDHPRRESLQQVVEQCLRMRDIVQSLQRFSETPENVEHVPVDLAKLCDMVVRLAGSAIAESKIAVRLSFPASLPQVQGSADELRQALLHLVNNAVRAMPEGGELTLAGHEVEEAVSLSVADTGKGIPAEQLGRIFEPFFSLEKTETHRPGLGLSVVHRIISEHHGRISVRSKLGEGTELTIILPGRRQELHLK